MIDAIDRKLLTILQRAARTTNAEIARRLKMAPSAIFERIRKLEAKGVIRGYEARLDPRALGLGLTAFIFVRAEEPAGATRTGRQLAAIPEVLEVHHVAGEDCYLVKVRVRDTEDLGRLLNAKVGRLPSVRSTRTTIALGTIKETGQLPVAARVEEHADA